MSSVLLLVNEEAHIRELSRVAELLLREGELQPVFFVEDRMKQHLGVFSDLRERNVEVLTSDMFVTNNDVIEPLGPQRRSLRQVALQSMLGCLRFASRTLLRHKGDLIELVDHNKRIMLRRAAVCDAVLSQREYRCVVLSEDNVELDTSVWIAVARRHGVRSVVVPYTISNTAEFAESYVHYAPLQVETSPQNRLTALLFPKWALRYKGKHFLRSHCSKIIATDSLGLSPPNPWLLNSGFADAIAVESLAMRDYYLVSGIPADQLAITGSLTDDVILGTLNEATANRRKLTDSLGLQPNKPLLLAALPPDQNTYERPGCEFVNFDDLLRFWGETLGGIAGWNIVVRPHPKTRPERLDLLRRHGLTISYVDTAALVPLCDVYVAAVSATIRWAIACGKPVINYDVYQYGYLDYQGIEGVVLANTRNEFADLIDRVTSDVNELERLKAHQVRESARWAMLDGQSGWRMIALLSGQPFSSDVPAVPIRETATLAASAAAGT
jgi:hypothetical protein